MHTHPCTYVHTFTCMRILTERLTYILHTYCIHITYILHTYYIHTTYTLHTHYIQYIHYIYYTHYTHYIHYVHDIHCVHCIRYIHYMHYIHYIHYVQYIYYIHDMHDIHYMAIGTATVRGRTMMHLAVPCWAHKNLARSGENTLQRMWTSYRPPYNVPPSAGMAVVARQRATSAASGRIVVV